MAAISPPISPEGDRCVLLIACVGQELGMGTTVPRCLA